jgi:hypothetical protein
MEGQSLRYKLEHEIQTRVRNDNGCSVHFDYDESDFVKVASAYTINPVTNETFLMKTATGSTIDEALNEIIKHIRSITEKFPFAVEWVKAGESNKIKHMSYFYCHDMLEVMQTFYKDKNRVDYVIWKCELRPSA